MWLNSFPSKSGISELLLPREIIIRQKLDFTKHCKAQFGSFCEVFDDPSSSNTMVARTQPAICLRPTGNTQGTYKFFALNTKCIIKQRQFQTLLMPNLKVKTIKAMDKTGCRGNLIFANNKAIPYTWNQGVWPTKSTTPEWDTLSQHYQPNLQEL